MPLLSPHPNYSPQFEKSFELAVDCNIVVKSVTVALRSEFLIKDSSEYLLITISFNRLLLVICLIVPFG